MSLLVLRMVRPLPRPVTPFPRETEASYLRRLGAANMVPVAQLKEPSHWLYSSQGYVARLAVLSGQPEDSLLKAIPQLGRDPRSTRLDRTSAPHWACRRCAARRTGTLDRIEVWRSQLHDQVCVTHRLWTGQAVESPAYQLDLADLPDIVRAQRHHHRLLQRYGPGVVDVCYLKCSVFWNNLVKHGYRVSDRADRLLRLVRHNGDVRPWEPRRYAAVYPEIVQTMNLFAVPHWRQMAGSPNTDEFDAFRTEFARRLPAESPLRTTARPWFHQELRRMATRISVEARPDVESTPTLQADDQLVPTSP
jgi:hypothetical protein